MPRVVHFEIYGEKPEQLSLKNGGQWTIGSSKQVKDQELMEV